MNLRRSSSGEYRCTIEDLEPVPPHATFYGFQPAVPRMGFLTYCIYGAWPVREHRAAPRA